MNKIPMNSENPLNKYRRYQTTVRFLYACISIWIIYTDNSYNNLKAEATIKMSSIQNENNLDFNDHNICLRDDNVLSNQYRKLLDLIEFERRKGEDGIDGQLYEIKLIMLLLLQGLKQVEDNTIDGFYLATNMDKVGSFDDGVFKYYKELNGTKQAKILFLQAKHKLNPEKAKEKISFNKLLSYKKDAFTLNQYFMSYREIKDEFLKNSKGPIFGNTFEDCEFIIYSNALPDGNFNEKHKNLERVKLNQEDILNVQSSNYYYRLIFGGDKKIDEKIVDVLQQTSDCKILAKKLFESIFIENFVDIDKGIIKSYRFPLSNEVLEKTELGESKLRSSFLSEENRSEFKSAFIEEVQKKEEYKGKTISELNSNLNNKHVKVPYSFSEIVEDTFKRELPNDVVSGDEIKDFFSKLKIFIEQPGEARLTEIIKQKIQLAFKVKECDVDSIFYSVKDKVENWWKDNTTKTHYLTEKNRFFHDTIRISIQFEVKEPVRLFTGRTEELADLHATINRSSQSERITVISQMTSLSGLGGIGKTELARKYIQEYSKHYDNNIIWINAESEGTLAESFMRLAKTKLKINIDNPNGKQKRIKSIVEDVYKYFSKRKSLFVFDNAEKNEYFEQFLPQSILGDANKPYILITSRLREWTKGIEVVNINELKLEEAIEFVKKGLLIPIEDLSYEQEIKKLVETLQRFPLAMQQAIAYIRNQNEYSIKNYLEDYEKNAKELLNVSIELDTETSKTTFTTWKITINKLKSEEYGQLALRILDAIAYFASERINRRMLLSLASNNEKNLKAAVRLLISYSMINGQQKQSIINIHKLVQEVTRLELQRQGKEEKHLEELLELIKGSFNRENIDHAVSTWYFTDKYEELIKEYSFLPVEIIDELEGSARYEEASIFGKRVLEVSEEKLGSSHLDILSVKGTISRTFYELGKYNEAMTFAQNVLEKRIQVLDADHPDTLKTMHDIASILHEQGKYEEAFNLFNEVLNKEKKLLGEDNPFTLHTMSNLVALIDEQGKYDEALPLYQELLKKEEEVLGPNHPATLNTKRNKALTLYSLGKYDEAIQTLQEVLDKYKRTIGENHPSTLKVMHSIAVVLFGKGKYEESLKINVELLEKLKQVFSIDHPFTLNTMHNIAEILTIKGGYEEASKLFREVIDNENQILSTDHPQTLKAMNNRALLISMQGKPKEALKLYQEVLENQVRVLGRDHPDTLTTISAIALELSEKGEFTTALELCREVLDKLVPVLGLDHPETLAAIGNIASVLFDHGNFKESIKLYEQILCRQRRILGSNHAATLRTINNLALALFRQDKYTEALELYEEVLKTRICLFGEDHLDTLITLNNIALLLCHQEKYDESLERYLEVLSKEKEILGTNHPTTLNTMDSLASLLSKLERYDEALALYNEVLEKQRETLGPEHPSTLNTVSNKASLFYQKEDYDEALKMYEELLETQKRVLGIEHYNTLMSMNNIATVLLMQGKHDEALSLYLDLLEKQTLFLGEDHPDTLMTKSNIITTFSFE